MNNPCTVDIRQFALARTCAPSPLTDGCRCTCAGSSRRRCPAGISTVQTTLEKTLLILSPLGFDILAASTRLTSAPTFLERCFSYGSSKGVPRAFRGHSKGIPKSSTATGVAKKKARPNSFQMARTQVSPTLLLCASFFLVLLLVTPCSAARVLHPIAQGRRVSEDISKSDDDAVPTSAKPADDERKYSAWVRLLEEEVTQDYGSTPAVANPSIPCC